MRRKFKFKFVAIILVFVLALSIIPVNAEGQNSKQVILGGTPFGLKLFTNGVIIIKIDDGDNPANNAGLKVNDLIVNANGQKVNSNEQFKSIVERCDGKAITLSVVRDNQFLTKTIVPVIDENHNFVLKMWIRDSTAGIGTVTYFDSNNNTFGALGHGICDSDTGMLMPLRDGEIMSATISSYNKGTDGVLGGLNGYFENETIGNISINNDFGVYGTYTYTDNRTMVEVASDDEICTGSASIVSTIEGTTPKEYSVEIVKLNLTKTNGQNMIVKVTDEELIEKTGGIIQGMSGSPIIQNGKLIGAVTHVFVNSPEKGYGITISNMMSSC